METIRKVSEKGKIASKVRVNSENCSISSRRAPKLKH